MRKWNISRSHTQHRPGGIALSRLRVHQRMSSSRVQKLLAYAPLMTFPLAVFLKNLRWVISASSRGRLRIVISTMKPDFKLGQLSEDSCLQPKEGEVSRSGKEWEFRNR